MSKLLSSMGMFCTNCGTKASVMNKLVKNVCENCRPVHVDSDHSAHDEQIVTIGILKRYMDLRENKLIAIVKMELSDLKQQFANIRKVDEVDKSSSRDDNISQLSQHSDDLIYQNREYITPPVHNIT